MLLWDEPEISLCPNIYPLITDILLALKEQGVQIFIATHCYNLVKYLESHRQKKDDVLYHNLYIDSRGIKASVIAEPEEENCTIRHSSGYYLSELKQNTILIADEKLLDEVLRKALKED